MSKTEPQNPTDSDVSHQFELNPTAENYLRLRRRFPNQEIQFGISNRAQAGHIFIPMLESNGIDFDLFALADSGNKSAISEVSLILLQKLIDREKLKNRAKLILSAVD